MPDGCFLGVINIYIVWSMVPFGIPQTCVLCVSGWAAGARGMDPTTGTDTAAMGTVTGVRIDVVVGAAGAVITRAWLGIVCRRLDE